MRFRRSDCPATSSGSAARSRLHGPVLVPALVLAFGLGACDDSPLTAPVSDTPITSEPFAAVFVAPAPVDIAPDGTSSTGIPLMTVDADFDEGVVSMNNHHVILGNAHSPTHGFTSPMLWTGGPGLVDLMPDRPYTPGAYGHDINDANAVTGVGASTFGGLGVGWVLDADGLHTLPDPPNYDFLGFAGRDIAEDGTAHVFYFRDSPSGNTGAVITPPYTAGDYFGIPLGDPSSGSTQHVNAQDVEGGLVVGGYSSQAWTWAPGDPALSFIDGIFGDATNGTDIVGRARFDGDIHAAILGGTAQDLGTLGGTFSIPRDLNTLGWVAGWGPDAGGQDHGFAWRPGDAALTDLGTLDGHVRSQALAIDDHGHVLGISSTSTSFDVRPVVVIWFPFEDADTAPDIQTIVSQVATVDEPFLLEPVVIDAEGDPFTLSWSGDIPPEAVINGVFEWTPTADDIGDYEITLTATQDDDPTLSDSETFVLSVVAAATPDADLQVSLAPDAIQQRLVGEAIAYTATVHNAGPDAVVASIQVEAEFSEQSNWGGTQEPPEEEGVINGVFFLELGEVPAGETVQVPFEVVFEAFGTQQLSATVAGNHVDSDPGNDLAALSEAVDLPLSTAGLEFAALGVPGANTTDGEPLVVVGVRVPAALVAGTEDGMPDMFVPSTLTPDLLAGGQYVPGGDLIVGDSYIPGDRALGGEVIPGDGVIAGEQYVPGDEYLPGDAFSPGDVYIPQPDEWLEGTARLAATDVPPGRLLFDNGAGTDLLVPSLGDTELTLGKTETGPLAIGGGGTGKVSVDLCGGGYSALLGDGDAGTFACGSLTVKTLTGEITVVLADGTTVTVLAGASVQITEDTEGGFDVEILAGTEDDVVVTPPAVNAAPQADAGGAYVVAVGAYLLLDGTMSSDPDGDPLDYAWVLGDGGSTSLLAEGPTPTLTAPAEAGLYSLTLTVTDPGGLSSSATVEVAVYDPDGASVAGGGWYHSPAGALVADPAAEGRATFAFHVRYKKGASVPDGSARLVFEAGGLRLTSDAFEWLVVGGSMARFRGVGQLDGREGPVRFEIVGRDPDEVRVRIWDDAVEIYDSGGVQIDGGRVVVKG